MASTKVVTGLVRFSYVNIASPRSFNDGQDPKYSMCVMVPKKDKKTLAKIKSAVKAASEEGVSKCWNGKHPSNLHMPLRDGDEERADESPEFKGMWFFNCSTKRKPGVVDREKNEILDLDEVYSGCWGRVSVNFYPYSVSGNKGVAAGLNNVLKWKDGERLGGSAASAEDDFNDDFSLEEDDDFNIDDTPF